MSWDVFVMDLPNVESVSEIPKDFKPKPIGKQNELILRIQEVVPFADFSDPSWGIINTEDFSIEVSMGNEEDVDCIAFHVRGESGGGACVANIVKHLGLKALDTGTGEFLDFNNPEYGFDKWRVYRDKCIEKYRSQTKEE